MNDLKALARQYAALKPNWPVPGTACTSPSTGRRYRRSDRGRWTCEGKPVPFGTGRAALDAAIAAGPDLDDPATLGALLLGLPDFGLFAGLDAGSVVWRCSDGSEHGRSGATRAEAIIRAAIAALVE